MSKTKITARYVIGHNGREHQILENGEVVFENDTIIFTGFNYPEKTDASVDVGNAVVGPGFVDLDAPQRR